MTFYNKVYQDIIDIFETYDIKYPINSWDLAKQMNLKIVTYYEITKKYNCPREIIKVFNSDISFLKNGIIYINEEMPRYVQNFNILHEIYHYYDDHIENSKENENLCNCFARNMIAPAFLINNNESDYIQTHFHIYGTILETRMHLLNTDAKYFKNIFDDYFADYQLQTI